MEKCSTIVIDSSSNQCKAGFAGDQEPCAIFPALVGYQRGKSSVRPCPMFIDEEVDQRNMQKVFPATDGIIDNWDCMEFVWYYAMHNKLRVLPDCHSVLVTEGFMAPKSQHEKVIQTLFETFYVQSAYIAEAPVLTLHASGLTTGIVVDSGDCLTRFVPVFEGYCMRRGAVRMDLTDHDLMRYMTTLLSKARIPYDTEFMWNLKTKCCYVPLECKQGNAETYTHTDYIFPDGNTIQIDSNVSRCPEALFTPILIGKEFSGIQEGTFRSISACDLDIRPSLYANIVISGDITVYRGLCERLAKELAIKASSSMNIAVTNASQHSVWKGGSVLASISTFEQFCITRNEYEEEGPSVVHRKCF